MTRAGSLFFGDWFCDVLHPSAPHRLVTFTIEDNMGRKTSTSSSVMFCHLPSFSIPRSLRTTSPTTLFRVEQKQKKEQKRQHKEQEKDKGTKKKRKLQWGIRRKQKFETTHVLGRVFVLSLCGKRLGYVHTSSYTEEDSARQSKERRRRRERRGPRKKASHHDTQTCKQRQQSTTKKKNNVAS